MSVRSREFVAYKSGNQITARRHGGCQKFPVAGFNIQRIGDCGFAPDDEIDVVQWFGAAEADIFEKIFFRDAASHFMVWGMLG